MFGWNWNLLGTVPAIFMGCMILVLLWGVRQMWKSNNKFLAFVFLIIAVAMGIMMYSIYGNKITG